MATVRFLACLALLAAAPANAQDDKTVTIQWYGFPGNDSCADWAVARSSNYGAIQFQGWVMGFVTARNYYSRENKLLGYGKSANALFSWIDLYCKDRPLNSIMTATIALLKELERK